MTPKKSGTNSKSAEVRQLLESGMSAAEIAKKVGCTVGLVYNVKSTSGKTKGKSPKGKRGPGRPRKNATGSGSGLDDIIAAVKDGERERAQMRAALERIQAVIAEALG